MIEAEIDPNGSSCAPHVARDLRDLLEHVIIPNIDRLIAVWARGGVATLVWKGGRARVARLTRQERTSWVNAIPWRYPTRPAAARWLRRKDGHRLLVQLHDDILCLNFNEASGFTIEPNT